MEPQILKAMPRQLAIKWMALYGAIGLVVVLFSQALLFPWVKEYLSVKDQALALFRFKVVMCGFGAGLLPPVVYMFWVSHRILTSRQFPHPGEKVFRDTPIVHGSKALFRGLILGLCALVILGCAIFMAYLPFLLFDKH